MSIGQGFWWGAYKVGGDPSSYWLSGDGRWAMTRLSDWMLWDRVAGEKYFYSTFDEMMEDLQWWYTQFWPTATVEAVL